MYSDVFCKVYNEFGWNYYPEAFGEQLLAWMERNAVQIKSSLDLACGTGVLCEMLHARGIRARGMDLSEGMIAIARSRCPEIAYDVADMTAYRPEVRFDLVTCTGDALNHILKLGDVETVFENVFGYLEHGGYFIFDLLDEQEISTAEPFELEFSETVTARFRITRPTEKTVNLRTEVFENGVYAFEENVTETVHDRDAVCALLRKQGFELVKCAHRLNGDDGPAATTWFLIARKP